MNGGKTLGLADKHAFFEFILSQKHFMNRLFLFTSVFLIVFEFVFGLLYSHRICGPFQKMKNFLDDEDPNKTKALLTFRKTDYFGELADSFNQFMNRRK
jgi:signal transduction histidine kinase